MSMLTDHDAVDEDSLVDNDFQDGEPVPEAPKAVDPARIAARLAVRSALAEQGISVEALTGAVVIEVPGPNWMASVSMA